jgi:hypothetical protein
MGAPFKLVLAAFLSIAITLPSFAQSSCPAIGSAKPGGAPLPITKQQLNRLKNRTEVPSVVEPMKVGDILHFDDRHDPELEKKAVVLEGFLLGFKREGPESPNCYSDTRRDFHMWVGPRRPTSPEMGMALRVQAVVVEPTPAMQDLHPTWDEENFNELVGQQVRVTGWLMFDPEHPDQIAHTRGTLWEVHPVMKIEVFHGGSWVEF